MGSCIKKEKKYRIFGKYDKISFQSIFEKDGILFNFKLECEE